MVNSFFFRFSLSYTSTFMSVYIIFWSVCYCTAALKIILIFDFIWKTAFSHVPFYISIFRLWCILAFSASLSQSRSYLSWFLILRSYWVSFSCMDRLKSLLAGESHLLLWRSYFEFLAEFRFILAFLSTKFNDIFWLTEFLSVASISPTPVFWLWTWPTSHLLNWFYCWFEERPPCVICSSWFNWFSFLGSFIGCWFTAFSNNSL